MSSRRAIRKRQHLWPACSPTHSKNIYSRDVISACGQRAPSVTQVQVLLRGDSCTLGRSSAQRRSPREESMLYANTSKGAMPLKISHVLRIAKLLHLGTDIFLAHYRSVAKLGNCSIFCQNQIIASARFERMLWRASEQPLRIKLNK
jgi:hypothetical protein